MEVGLVRSIQPADILLIHWRVYNSIANTSKGVLFLPLSDVYVRSFLYLLYILIKLYYTKALSNQALSLGPGLNSSPPEAKNPGIFSWFSNNLSIGPSQRPCSGPGCLSSPLTSAPSISRPSEPPEKPPDLPTFPKS